MAPQHGLDTCLCRWFSGDARVDDELAQVFEREAVQASLGVREFLQVYVFGGNAGSLAVLLGEGDLRLHRRAAERHAVEDEKFELIYFTSRPDARP